MKPTHRTSTLSTWLFWAPARFAVLSVLTSFLVVFAFDLIANFFNITNIYINYTCILALITVALAISTIITIKKLPQDTAQHQTFISVHTAQSVMIYTISAIQLYIFIKYADNVYRALFSPNQYLPLLVFSIFNLYIFGIFIANIYAKYRRIRALNIPTWKIICSMPFGFSALWTPGYFLAIPDTPSLPQSPAWYKKIVLWISARPAHTAIAYTTLVVLSCLCFSIKFVLLTCAMALLFGIWTIQVGTKHFAKNMHKTYANIATALNITIIVTMLVFNIFLPRTTSEIQVNISDIEMTTEPTE